MLCYRKQVPCFWNLKRELVTKGNTEFVRTQSMNNGILYMIVLLHYRFFQRTIKLVWREDKPIYQI